MGVLDVGIAQLEAIEAAARHKEQLIAAYIAGCAQFSGESPLVAQLPGLGVAASFGRPGEFCGDQTEVLQIRGDLLYVMRRREHHAQGRAARQPGIRLQLPLCQRHDQRRSRIARGLGNIAPFVDNNLCVTQQAARHRLAP